jgi:hypothetical protein
MTVTIEESTARCSAAFENMMRVANDHDLTIKDLAEVGLNMMCWALESSTTPVSTDVIVDAVNECRKTVSESMQASHPVQ